MILAAACLASLLVGVFMGRLVTWRAFLRGDLERRRIRRVKKMSRYRTPDYRTTPDPSTRPITRPRWWWVLGTEAWRGWRRHLEEAKEALPDGTRVRLICEGCGLKNHDGVWRTSWTPRRNGNYDDPNDYLLTRETDEKHTYAARDALEVVQ